MHRIDSPSRIALFNEIASHVYDQLQANSEPALKRRKVDSSQPGRGANGASQPSVGVANAGNEAVALHVKEISVSVPQRKKFEICLSQNFIYARAPGTTEPITGIVYAWKDIGMKLNISLTAGLMLTNRITEYIFYLPVPEKAQVQHNYILLPRGTSLASKTNPPSSEPLVFTVPATAPKEGTIGGTEAAAAAAVSDTYRSLFHWAFERRLRAAGNNISTVSANPNKFHSVVRQPHRPNEKAVHVSGFRGSKDGYLFFLENGILWGFKKPLIFIPLNRIAAISYTNILQITFNMVVEVFGADGEENEELEFGMLDQKDYGGIDDYVKQNRLQDRSMAEQRKAKLQLAENRGPKKEDGQSGDTAGQAGTNDDMTELERAQLEHEQQVQDDEDEDEEDYDPGSEGDSEGSGESSAEDDDANEDGDDDGVEDEDEEEAGEDEEEVEDEEEEEPAPAPPPPVVKTEKVVKQTKSPVPVRQGWAALSSAKPKREDDMDEKFDVL